MRFGIIIFLALLSGLATYQPLPSQTVSIIPARHDAKEAIAPAKESQPIAEERLPEANVTTGPICRLPHYEQLIGFTQGGDDHYYLAFSASGSVGSFSGYGESVITLRRFDPDLKLTHELSIGKGRGVDQITNVYGMLPSDQGIALISIMRTENGVPAWFLCHPTFSKASASFDCDSIFPMPGHNPGLTNPTFRTTTNSQGLTAVAWRSLDQPEDNSLRVMIFDKHLNILQEPIAPFLKWNDPIDLSYWTLLDENRIIFQIHGQEGPKRRTDSSGGIGMVVHDFREERNHLFSMTNHLMVPLSLSGSLHPVSGRIMLAGLYADRVEENLEVGLFLGEFLGGDTLSNLRTLPFGEEMWNFLVYEEGRNENQFRFRRPFQQIFEFIPANRNRYGILHHPYLVLDFMGRPNGTFRVKGTSMVARSLLCYDLGPGGGNKPFLDHEYQISQYEEHQNSWGIGYSNRCMTLIDCAHTRNDVRPYGYEVSQFQVKDESGKLAVTGTSINNRFAGKGRDFTVMRPRFSTGDAESQVVVSRFRNKLRLVRIRIDSE